MTSSTSSTDTPPLQVIYTCEASAVRAKQLAARLHTEAKLQKSKATEPTAKGRQQHSGPRLIVDAENTTLEWGESPPTRLRLTFIEGKNRYRADNSKRRDETLARALGLGKSLSPDKLARYSVLDATSGLGRDAWTIASFGCSVIMMERCIWLQWMQREALTEALAHPATQSCARRITLVQANAISWLEQGYASDVINAIYLDPMYPARNKSAAVKKDMQALQQLIGKDHDSNELLSVALRSAENSGINRVVVKRPRGADPIENELGIKVHHQHESRNTRYDVYQTE